MGGLKIGRVELRGCKVLITPADEDGGGGDSTNSFDKIMGTK
jgi:predicted lipoprotein